MTHVNARKQADSPSIDHAASEKIRNPVTIALLQFLDFSGAWKRLSKPRTFMAGLILFAIKPFLIVGALLFWPSGFFLTVAGQLYDTCSSLREDLKNERRFDESVALALSLFFTGTVVVVLGFLALPVLLISGTISAIWTIRNEPKVAAQHAKEMAVYLAGLAAMGSFFWSLEDFGCIRGLVFIGFFILFVTLVVLIDPPGMNLEQEQSKDGPLSANPRQITESADHEEY